MKCPICKGSHVIDLVYHQEVYRCITCDHLFRGNTDTFTYDFYQKHDYWYKDPIWRIFQKTYFAFFEQFIGRDPDVIEYGAANGDFLHLVWMHMTQVMQIKPNIYYNELIDIASPDFECFIPLDHRWIGPIEDLDGLVKNKFGNVFLIEVLEHFKDPQLCMDIIERQTKNGGRILIATDNGEHLNAANMMFQHQEHLNIFTQKSFEWMIKPFNFDMLLYWSSPVGKSYIVLEKK
ncbi:MAG: methyltransferase domain-containing protein [Candidatus Peribacteraceae bacterium]|nr:methyltransferase domain-containing protein [Candidatus Peribacteraceae bacterium]